MSALERLRAALPEDIDAGLVLSDVNRRYFTGFPSSAGVLLVLRDAAYFLIDFRYYHKAKAAVTDAEVIEMTSFETQLRELFSRHRVMTVGLETKGITLAEYLRYRESFSEVCFDTGTEFQDAITALRQIKTPAELTAIRTAQKITDTAFSQLLPLLHIGMTEREIAWTLEKLLRENGAEGMAFDIIAASGENSASPHATPTDRRLQKGDFLTLDFGARYDGYCSDMTRTVAIGEPTGEMRRVYELVLAAQNAAFDRLSPDTPCKEVDRAARLCFADMERYFGHGLGHSVGLEIHETPACNTRDETRLAPGMMMTVEPGLYLSGRFGVRIEDLAVVTENGYEDLTASPKELIIL